MSVRAMLSSYAANRRPARRTQSASQAGSEVGIPSGVTGGPSAWQSTFPGASQAGGTVHVPDSLSPTGQAVTGAGGGTAPGVQGPSPFEQASSYLNPQALALQGFNNTALHNTQADLGLAAGYGQADFGYTGQDTNGDGIPDSGFTVDPSNPFSKASLLQKAYDQNQRGTTNNYAAQGQLYSGALQNAQNENTFQNQQGVNQNLRDFQRLMESLSRQNRDATLGTSQENANIDWQALLAAVQGAR